MNPVERRAAFSLALIYAVRMLGLFMILPVFAIYADRYQGATPVLIGVAVGIYGLTQALFQIPFGLWSDRFGRHRLILIGLLLFAAGSVMAALAESIVAVIAGRAVQGAGAIAAVVMALGADLTRDAQRTKLMAIIGGCIGLSFVLAFIAGPALAGWGGTEAVFWANAGFAALGILVLYALVPRAPPGVGTQRTGGPPPIGLRQVLGNVELRRLDFGVFVLHMTVTANFLAVPWLLVQAGVAQADHGWLYLPVLLASLALMVPMLVFAERGGRTRGVMLLAVAGIAGAELWLALGWRTQSVYALAAMLVVFFTMFNVLEASMPSLVSRIAPPAAKGAAMGAFSTSQFSGAFAGGLLGGWLLQWGMPALFSALAVCALAWLGVAWAMRAPRKLTPYTLRVPAGDGRSASEFATRLKEVRGVAEAVVVGDEGVAYLQVDKSVLDESALRRCC